MKKINKILQDLLDYSIFIMFFVIILIPLMISGAIAVPIRFFKYTINKANNKECKTYWY
ncbi:MAG: hypothetical protein QXI16_00580 [Sulfolobaceae archaeon]